MAKENNDAKLEPVIGEECHYSVGDFSTIGGFFISRFATFARH